MTTRRHNSRAGHRVSITEVARLAGVSYQTVSRVINDSPNVSDATRDRVKKMIAKLDYHPLNSARALVTRRSHVIGFVAGGTSYYGPISTIGALEARARDHGLAVSVAIYNEHTDGAAQFESAISMLSRQGADALVYLAPTSELLHEALAVRSDRPAVFLTSTSHQALQAARASDPSQRRFVGIDQAAGEEQVLDLLERQGHRNLLLLTGPQEWADASVRLEALSAGAIRRGLHYQVVTEHSWDPQDAERDVHGIYAGRRLGAIPDAIVAANDLQAFGAMRALARLGIRVPQEVSVTGFDDMPGADAVLPSLTTVRPDFQALGNRAMREVLDLLGGSDSEGDSAGRTGRPVGTAGGASSEDLQVRAEEGICLIRPRLIERESTAPRGTMA